MRVLPEIPSTWRIGDPGVFVGFTEEILTVYQLQRPPAEANGSKPKIPLEPLLVVAHEANRAQARISAAIPGKHFFRPSIAPGPATTNSRSE